MPELFETLQRNESRSSKSFSQPSFQIRNVFPFALTASVVSPWMTPSFTDQSRESPSQPVRSFPLKIAFISSDSAGALIASAAKAGIVRRVESAKASERVIVVSEGKSGGKIYGSD